MMRRVGPIAGLVSVGRFFVGRLVLVRDKFGHQLRGQTIELVSGFLEFVQSHGAELSDEEQGFLEQ